MQSVQRLHLRWPASDAEIPQQWHMLTTVHTVLPATHTFFHKWNEPSCIHFVSIHQMAPSWQGKAHMDMDQLTIHLSTSIGWKAELAELVVRLPTRPARRRTTAHEQNNTGPLGGPVTTMSNTDIVEADPKQKDYKVSHVQSRFRRQFPREVCSKSQAIADWQSLPLKWWRRRSKSPRSNIDDPEAQQQNTVWSLNIKENYVSNLKTNRRCISQ